MRSRLLDLLACPACRGRLSVAGLLHSRDLDEGEDDQEILDGVLRCLDCSRKYPVTEGVPSLLLDRKEPGAILAGRLRDRIARFYGHAWRRPCSNRMVAVGYETHLDMVAGVVPFPVFEKGTGLDAGCGGGRDLGAMASRWPEIEFIGVDLSDGVYTAHERVRGLPNAHVVRGDLLAMPFPDGHFDTVYSYGVLHHTLDPAAGMRELVRVSRPNGRIITYVYEDFSGSRLGSRLVVIENAVRRAASQLPPGVLYAASVVMAPVVFLGFTLPSRLLRRLKVTRPLAESLPFRHALNPRGLVGDLYDRFVPVCHRFSREAILGLYRECGVKEVGTTRRRGWVTWGSKALRYAVPERTE